MDAIMENVGEAISENALVVPTTASNGTHETTEHMHAGLTELVLEAVKETDIDTIQTEIKQWEHEAGISQVDPQTAMNILEVSNELSMPQIDTDKINASEGNQIHQDLMETDAPDLSEEQYIERTDEQQVQIAQEDVVQLGDHEMQEIHQEGHLIDHQEHVIQQQDHVIQQDGIEIQDEVQEIQEAEQIINQDQEEGLLQDQVEHVIQEEEAIHAEMTEIHEGLDESAEMTDGRLQIDETSINSADTDTEVEHEHVIEEEMILEETTGEYVLASSLIREEVVEEIPMKRTKTETEDEESVGKTKHFKNELQPGERIVVMAKDEKGNAQEVLLTHTTTTTDKNGVIIQHVVDETGEIYLLESVDSNDEAEAEPEEEEVIPVRRTRSKKLQIPNHVLGRNIVNPVEDTFRNGKPPPKPRLGVKIPYRNLTSQIVSKQEIADEILERSRRFSNNMFAQKLTQNLAKKLQPKLLSASPKPRGRPPLNRLPKKVTEKIDNSDLLAILEGDDAPVDSKESMTTEMEREIALKQLQELPEDPPAVKKDVEKKDKKINKSTHEESMKSPFCGNAPLKTYGRKRKTSEDVLQQITSKPIISKQENPASNSNTSPSTPRTPASSKASAPSTPDSTYVTKSSRIIKKKVIWDPDAEQPKKDAKSEVRRDSGAKDIKKDTKELKKDSKDLKKDQSSQDKKVESPRKPAEIAKKTPDTSKKTTESSKKAATETAKKPATPLKMTRSQKRESESEVEEQEAEKSVEEEGEEEEMDEEEKPPEKPSTPMKIKRRLGEVSKLLMDEGAINMLYAIKNEDGPTTRRPKKSLQSKADELLNDLNDMTSNSSDKASPKALRKKETSSTPVPAPKTPKKIMCPPTPSPISRQKSKDSNRSSVHSPPPSPGPTFSGVESRIIRRHSSSSYSSMGEEDEEERRVKKIERGRRKALQSTMPESKKKRLESKPSQAVKSKNDNFEKLVEIKLNASEQYNKYKNFSVNSLNKLVQIDLGSTHDDDNNVYLTNDMMEEISSLLKDLETDKNVNVVLLTSDGPVYCNGINFKSLVIPKEAARKAAAKKLATRVKDFLLCLARFPKVLVAGIHGDSYGIGVTMLPLFDMIIAHEEASFTIPNAKLGCIAEGASLLLLPHLSRNVLINELLYSSQTLSAGEALNLGLVTKILPKSSYSRELLSAVKGVSDKSAQFMVATKKQLRQRMIPDITTSLTEETDNLIEQWTSEECQKNFTEFFSDTD